MKITKAGFAIIDNDTHIGKWIEESGRLDFDQNALPLILEFIKDGDVVIDAGANVGAYSFAFKDKASEVICFEPNPKAFECLKYNLSKFDNVFLMNSALGIEPGKGIIIDNENAGASFVNLNTKGNIRVSTIDIFNIPKVDFIKIDVEGFELKVLQGAIKTIQKFKPKLYIEINSETLKRCNATAHDIFYFLDIFKYNYRNIYEEQPMDGLQYDIICW